MEIGIHSNASSKLLCIYSSSCFSSPTWARLKSAASIHIGPKPRGTTTTTTTSANYKSILGILNIGFLLLLLASLFFSLINRARVKHQQPPPSDAEKMMFVNTREVEWTRLKLNLHACARVLTESRALIFIRNVARTLPWKRLYMYSAKYG